MGPLRDIHLSRRGALLLAAVSLAATIFVLIGANAKTDAQLAAEAALAHPRTTVDVVAPTPTTPDAASSSGGSGGSAATISPPASAATSGTSSPGAGTPASRGTSGSGGDTSGAGTGASTSAATTSSPAPTTATTTTPAPDAGLPKVGHVFLVTLSTPSYRAAFGARSPARYLRALARRGTVLSGYHALARHGLADLLALVSGQAPNRDTAAGCPVYRAFPETAKVTAAGIAKGTGCVYPDGALTVADEATAAGKSWGAYVADMGAGNCAVPASGGRLDTPLDGTQEGYDVAHNPFAFFGSLLDAGGCSEYDQALTNLPAALAKRARTPNLTYLAGDACVDAAPTPAPAGTATGTATTTTAAGTTPAGTTAAGTTAAGTTPAGTTPAAGATPAAATTPTAAAGATPAATTATATTPVGTATPTTPAATTTAAATTATSTVPARLIPPAAYGCPSGEPSGIAGEDAFLKLWVPRILASAAYRANGVLVIAFTGADGRAHADTGALVISRWTPKDTRLTTSYDAYGLLHSIEDMLDLAPLARAATAPAFATRILR